MSRGFCVLSILLLLVSCAGNSTSLPVLTPLSGQPTGCQPIFPQGDFQFVHLVEFSMAGGNHGSAMGVTVIRDKTIETALMTVEGLVLFAATLNNGLTVSRAVPPFDKPAFAEGLMRDIRAIFLQPQGEMQSGILADGTLVCRICEQNGQITDNLASEQFCRQRFIYSATGDNSIRLSRRITGRDCSELLAGTGIPLKLSLTSLENRGYSLDMTLISAEELP
jgi:hypothetical protein